jgi:hypothetical protein
MYIKMAGIGNIMQKRMPSFMAQVPCGGGGGQTAYPPQNPIQTERRATQPLGMRRE